VYFHGSALGTPLDGVDQLARQGAVVVGPRWVLPGWSLTSLNVLTPEEYVDGYWFDVASCAFAAAQDVASTYGGDLDRTTVVGFSAGVHPAIRTGLGDPRNDLCPDRQPTVRPTALVTGDSQFLFQGNEFDAAFEDSDSLASDTVDRILNPQRWASVPDGFGVYLWSTESGAYLRESENPPGVDSWLRTRLPGEATLFDDLDAVGAFDDGRIGFQDNGRLLEKRLQDQGVPVVHEVFPTDHFYAPGVYDRISELVFDRSFG
jgi:acetyl esterase/lipase